MVDNSGETEILTKLSKLAGLRYLLGNLLLCYGFNCVKTLAPNITIFGDGIFGKIIEVKCGYKHNLLIQQDKFSYKREISKPSLADLLLLCHSLSPTINHSYPLLSFSAHIHRAET